MSSAWADLQSVHGAPIANPPNSAQLGGIPYHSLKLHPGPCSSVGMWPRTGRHIDARDHYTFRVVPRLTRNVTMKIKLGIERVQAYTR